MGLWLMGWFCIRRLLRGRSGDRVVEREMGRWEVGGGMEEGERGMGGFACVWWGM